MSNRTINRILISLICFFSMAICVLIVLILTRPQQVSTHGAFSATLEEIPATEIINFHNSTPSNISSSEAVSTPQVPEEEPSALYAKTTSLLNIREANNTDSSVLTTVSENTILQVLEIQADGWTKVVYGEHTGYVSSAYIILIQD